MHPGSPRVGPSTSRSAAATASASPSRAWKRAKMNSSMAFNPLGSAAPLCAYRLAGEEILEALARVASREIRRARLVLEVVAALPIQPHPFVPPAFDAPHPPPPVLPHPLPHPPAA